MRLPTPTEQTIATLMQGHATAEIVCPIKQAVVRRLRVVEPGDQVEIDALTVKVVVPLSTPIMYEAWTFDRGSMLFELPDHNLHSPGARYGKLCTEFDALVFPDGTTAEARITRERRL